MVSGRRKIPFLGSHGYYVSTSSDEENNFDSSHECSSYEKYWRGDKERSLQEAANEVSDSKLLPQSQRSDWNQSFAFPALEKASCVRFTSNPYPNKEIFNHVSNTEAFQDYVNSQSMSVYFSSIQLRKSIACSEASHYSLQRSLELMAKSNYTDLGSNELAKKGSVQINAKNRSKGCETGFKHNHIIVPSREIPICAGTRELPINEQAVRVDHPEEISNATKNWSVNVAKARDGRVHSNYDDYQNHKHMDSELYYSHSRSFFQLGNKRLLAEILNADRGNTSDLTIIDLEDVKDGEEKYPSDTYSTVLLPLKECEGKDAYSATNVAAHKRDCTRSQSLKKTVSQRRSREKDTLFSKNFFSTNGHSPKLDSLEPMKLLESDCLIGEMQRLPTRAKTFRNTDDDLVNSDWNQHKRQQKWVRIRPKTEVHMDMDNSSHTASPCAETDHEGAEIGVGCGQVPSSPPCARVRRDKKDVSSVTKKEVAPHIVGERKEIFTRQSSLETRETTQKEQVILGSIDNRSSNTSSSPEEFTAPKCGEITEANGMVNLTVPGTTRNKEQILSKVNCRAGRAMGYRQSDIPAESDVINFCRKEAESHYRCLRRRQLHTLKVMDHNSPRSETRAVTKTLNLLEGIQRADAIYSHKFKKTRRIYNPKIDGEISNFFPEKENNVKSEVLEAEANETDKKMLAVSKGEILEVSNNPLLPQDEETNSLIQHPVAESCAKPCSQEAVQTQETLPELDGDVQSKTLLELLQNMQIKCPEPLICDKINRVKTGGMLDPAPQRGSYLAHYLKTQSRTRAGRLSVNK